MILDMSYCRIDADKKERVIRTDCFGYIVCTECVYSYHTLTTKTKSTWGPPTTATNMHTAVIYTREAMRKKSEFTHPLSPPVGAFS